MTTLTCISAGMLIAMLWMRIHFRSRPPDMSERGLQTFNTGLSLACFSSAALAGAYILWVLVNTKGLTPNPFFVLLAFGGNLCNAISIFYSLRELSSESLFAGLLIGIQQVCWILFGLMVMTVDF